jgi:hypothetical protein
MKIPPAVIGHLTTFLLAAQARGWIGLQGIEPMLKAIVDSGNGPDVRVLLGDVIRMLARIEADASRGQTR